MNGLTCPLPASELPRIVLAHGGGGRLMHRLIETVFCPAFGNAADCDAAVLPPLSGRLALTTDAFVVKPLVFPGGDIGTLAVHGTINDLAMMGARPLWLCAGFILEEGLPLETLHRIVGSAARAAAAAGVRLVAGDTKVVEHGRCDGMYIVTSGVGVLEHDREIAPASVRPGDAIVLSGDIGRHGIAVLAARHELEFEDPPHSDSAPLSGPVLDLLRAGVELHCLRDLTRGGLATALVEIARASRCRLEIREPDVPVLPAVQEACELLGFDPLYVANEGRMVLFLPAAQVETALAVLRRHPVSAGAVAIGKVCGDGGAEVTAVNALGTSRVLDLLSGEQLPRIC